MITVVYGILVVCGASLAAVAGLMLVPLGCAGCGGMVTVGFTYLFGLESTWAHRLMVASLAGVIALVLFTIGGLDHPFSGGARIETGAFELVLNRFETRKLSDL